MAVQEITLSNGKTIDMNVKEIWGLFGGPLSSNFFVLIFSGQHLNDEDAIIIAEALKKNKTLEKLSLYSSSVAC